MLMFRKLIMWYTPFSLPPNPNLNHSCSLQSMLDTIPPTLLFLPQQPSPVLLFLLPQPSPPRLSQSVSTPKPTHTKASLPANLCCCLLPMPISFLNLCSSLPSELVSPFASPPIFVPKLEPILHPTSVQFSPHVFYSPNASNPAPSLT